MARIGLRRILPVLAVACALAALGIYWAHARASVPAGDLVSLLPSANASVVYVDVDALRRSGILAMLAGAKAAEDDDYRQFVSATKFDYRQDLDAIAAAFGDGKTYFALRGRFHWKNIADYAARQGGSCHNDFCVVSGSQPNRRISFYPLKSNVLAMAIGPDDFAAYQVTAQPATPRLTTPNDPVWALIPAAALQKMDTLPFAAKAYIPALQSAEQIVFSVSADRARQLQLDIHVTCKDATAATVLQTQLESTTKALRDLIAHQHKVPDPSELSGVLVAGNFRRDDRQVFGVWPISKAFLDAVAGSAY
jgi:hypothetical protein